jgi:ornithine cyclodeaminase/alanine dehydrogenase-like protein (mu-crystallin family)
VVSGEADVPETGRRAFLNMGIAMDDVALGSYVLDLALQRGVGRTIEFP